MSSVKKSDALKEQVALLVSEETEVGETIRKLSDELVRLKSNLSFFLWA